jgi:hypothetical protein
MEEFEIQKDNVTSSTTPVNPGLELSFWILTSFYFFQHSLPQEAFSNLHLSDNLSIPPCPLLGRPGASLASCVVKHV